MCKFNNRLFVFALNCLISRVCILAKPVQDSALDNAEGLGALIALSALLNTPQDVHYDQRQKGEENYRIKLDGFFIGLPQEHSSDLLLLTDDMFENLDDDNLLAFGKNKLASMVPAASPASTVISSTASEPNKNLSSNATATVNSEASEIAEISAPKKYLEARQSVEPVTKTKSFISHLLSLLKRVHKH